MKYIESQGIAKILQSSCVTFSHITPITTLQTALFDLKGGKIGEAGGGGPEISFCIVLCAALSHSVMSNSVTPWTIARRSPLSTGMLQASIWEWVAMLSSRGSSQPRDQPRSLTLHVDSLPSEPPGKPNLPLT